MSGEEVQVRHTQHALLVAWGRFAQAMGLSQAIAQVGIKQKKHQHSPQSKVLEFLVATLAGVKYLQDISLAAHPLDKDQVVAEAWGQPGWADYSGVSRTLSGLSWAEAEQLVQVLEKVSQPYLDREVAVIRSRGERFQLDGDLTGIAVSSTSHSYPNAAFGHMDDSICLGYQAVVVSLKSPTYGRFWLSGDHRPGDTVACTQTESIVCAAERRLGLRPRRRTELLQQRLQRFDEQLATIHQRLAAQPAAVSERQSQVAALCQQENDRQSELCALEQAYQLQQRLERPTSRLSKARQRLAATQAQRRRAEKAVEVVQTRLAKTQARLAQGQNERTALQERLRQLEQDKATNPHPIEAEFRLDAGFGTYDNITLLIELGYEVYTKPFSHQVVRYLRHQVTEQTLWTRVGANAEMVAWPNMKFKGCPYPVDVALERFYTGKRLKHSA
ncbi:MAG: hypothetical protein L0332_01410 [Chloroflexi bacterium]|nr:hypothetical protein [Chloroflexota bacterium]MCI0577404.1 hypothetical protein [Chloroflexota bacterium]MCI0649610.1 hypothetical protein [Chloroflexota bacterium]MCI0725378.1 hypothetical protein [Chloroflexota bacterium]